MADNVTIKDGNSASVVMRSTDNAGIQTTVHALELGGSLVSGANKLPVDTGLPAATTTLPTGDTSFIPVMQAPQKNYRYGFDKVIVNGVDPTQVTEICVGSGMTRNQTAGSLVLTSGTTANSESIFRSPISFTGDMLLSYSITLSQRIANNNFYVELVDLIGDDLAFTINSATSVTVTIPNNPFTSQNVGQFMNFGNLTGTAGTIPARYAIASVSGNDVTFTVASFPGSGSGTVSLSGWNYCHVLYTSTTATQAAFGTQRNGWITADTTVSVLTTATGHSGIVPLVDGKASFGDLASTSGSQVTPRGTSSRNVPTDVTNLYVQIRATNGTTNPASTTTCTIGFYEVTNYVVQAVSVANVMQQSNSSTIPVTVSGTTAVSGTVTASSGGSAHDAAISGSPYRMGGRALTSNYTAVASGDTADAAMTVVGAQIIKPFSIPEVDWSYAAASGGISNTTTAVTIRAAQAAGIRNYVTGLDIMAEALGAATEVAIRDGASGTVLWRTKVGTGGLPMTQVEFNSPLRGTAATLLEVVTITATITGAVYFNARGYSAP